MTSTASGMMQPGSPTPCPTMQGLPGEALAQVAGYFQALAEPTRLAILNQLRERERNVGDLARLCGCTSANVSRHLTLLAQQGLVAREVRGNSAYFHIADPAVYELCDLVCGNIARRIERSAGGQASFVRMARGEA